MQIRGEWLWFVPLVSILAFPTHAAEPQPEPPQGDAWRALSQAQGWLNLDKPERALSLLPALPVIPQTLAVRAWTWVLTAHHREAWALLAPYDSLQGELLYLRGVARLHVQRGSEARSDLQHLWWTEPDTRFGMAALGQLAEAVWSPFDAEERAVIARFVPTAPTPAASHGGPQDWPAQLQALAQAAPPRSTLACEATYGQGLAELRLRHVSAAQRLLRQAAGMPHDAALEAPLHLALGTAASAAGAFETALQHLQQACTASGPLATEALAQAGEMATRLQRYPEAQAHWQALLVDNPVGGTRERALWGLGWAAYRAGDPAAAQRFFATLRQENAFGPWASAAAYWEGRALQDLGDTVGARRRWAHLHRHAPADYYAYRAELQLGPKPWPDADGNGDAAGPPPPTPAALRDIDALLQAGMQRRARLALQEALVHRRWAPSTLQHLARAARQADSPTLADAFEAMRCERFGATDPTCQTSLAAALQTPHWDAMHQAAQANRLDAALVLSVARVESNFMPAARSPAGALGLMQLMPATAHSLWAEERHRPLRQRDLLDPAINIRLGTRYLARLLRSFGRREEYALATYNAGGAAVNRWRAVQGDLPVDVFVEEIPFPETREYVKKVLSWRQLARLLRLAESGPTGYGSRPALP